MKRYLLFSGDGYYPNGGWFDFIHDFDDLESATQLAVRMGKDWYHVIDTNIMKQVDTDGYFV